MSGYDIIGDVHGCADLVEGLLRKLGYRELNGVYRYGVSGMARQAVFVGDLIDRGPQQLRTLQIVRAMVEDGSAQIVMGNHEFNAIAYATAHPERPGEFMRQHSDKNSRQHQAFLEQIGPYPELYAESLEWFRTQPIWLDLGGIRIVHACWAENAISSVTSWLPPGRPMTSDFVVKANRKGSPEYGALEVLLKGPEVSLAAHGQDAFLDKDGHRRNDARIRWWQADARSLRELAEIPPGAMTPEHELYPVLPDLPCPDATIYDYSGTQPVFYGHYWRRWKPTKGQDWTENTVCVDFSAVKGGPLVAYRWDKGSRIGPENYIEFGSRSPTSGR